MAILSLHSNARNLLNQKFGRITVIEKAGVDKYRNILWRCLCECGNITIVRGTYLINHRTRSCGCLHREISKQINTRHGFAGSKIYDRWQGMILRCNNPNNPKYASYGGRGITVCNRWLNFNFFLNDMGMPPKGTSLDRIDNNKGYTPDNTRWATVSQQSRNKRTNYWITFNGETKILQDWAEQYRMAPESLKQRLKKGMNIENALKKPLRGGNYGNI